MTQLPNMQIICNPSLLKVTNNYVDNQRETIKLTTLLTNYYNLIIFAKNTTNENSIQIRFHVRQ